MQEGLIALSETMPVILDGRRRHRRIAEARMLLYPWRYIARHVAARRLKTVMESLTGNLIELCRRRSCVNNNGPRMGTPGHGKRQQ